MLRSVISVGFLAALCTVAVFALPATARNVDLSGFAASCPQMAVSLNETERTINALRLSDRDFLRVQLVEYQALSRMRAPGRACREIKRFFEQQTEATRSALRNRANSSSGRARQMQEQLNVFISDMQTLQTSLGTVQVGLNATQNNTGQNASSGGSVAVATNCLRVLDHGWVWGLQNTCSIPIVVAVCYSARSSGDSCQDARGEVLGGSGFVNFSGGRINPGERVETLLKEGGPLKLAACDDRASRAQEGRSVRLRFRGNLSSFQCEF